MGIERLRRQQLLDRRRKSMGSIVRRPQQIQPKPRQVLPQPLPQLPAGSESSGIAISTYFGADTSLHRINIFLTSIYSLIASGFNGKIVIVDDCSDTDAHIKKVLEATDKIQCIRRPVNNGLGRCKNTCIKNLLDCKYLFLADDDMIYNGNWWSPYIAASIGAEIPHFSHYTHHPDNDHSPPKITYVKDVPIKQHFALNGCFLFATRDLISEIGGFKIMPYKYGFEHTNFTERCLKSKKIPFCCDVVNSENYLQLNKASLDNKSMKPDSQRAHRENLPTLANATIYEPIEE